MDLYVKNGDVFINGTFIKANITVKGGKIVSLSDENLWAS